MVVIDCTNCWGTPDACVSVLKSTDHQSRLLHHKQFGPLMIFSIHNLELGSCYLVGSIQITTSISQTVHSYGGIEHLWFQFLPSNRRLAKSYLFFQQWTKTNATVQVRGGGADARTRERVYKMLLPKPNTCVLSEPS